MSAVAAAARGARDVAMEREVTEHDRADFATLMLGLGETYGEPVSDARMELYFRALADKELADLRAAATVCVRVSKFFPRPAELIEAMGGSVEDRAELAWMAVQRMVRRFGFYSEPGRHDWPDDASRQAALELYGGWKALCSRLPGEGPELLGFAKQFKGAYRAYANRESREVLTELDTGQSAAALLGAVKMELMKRNLPTGGL